RSVVMLVAAKPQDDEQRDHDDEAGDPNNLHPSWYAAVRRQTHRVYVVTTAIEHKRRHHWNHQPIASDLQELNWYVRSQYGYREHRRRHTHRNGPFSAELPRTLVVVPLEYDHRDRHGRDHRPMPTHTVRYVQGREVRAS